MNDQLAKLAARQADVAKAKLAYQFSIFKCVVYTLRTMSLAAAVAACLLAGGYIDVPSSMLAAPISHTN